VGSLGENLYPYPCARVSSRARLESKVISSALCNLDCVTAVVGMQEAGVHRSRLGIVAVVATAGRMPKRRFVGAGSWSLGLPTCRVPGELEALRPLTQRTKEG